MVQLRSGLARERIVDEARERNGWRRSPGGLGGENPREDENQEGNGFWTYSKPVVQKHGFPQGATP